VDEVSLNRSIIVEDEGKDRNDQLDEKGLEGEVMDGFVDYKQEAVKAFVNIIELSKSAADGEEQQD
jgi:hypothetical protein